MGFDIFDRKYMVDLEYTSPTAYERLQRELFRVGFFWASGRKVVRNDPACAIYLNDYGKTGRLSFRSSRNKEFYSDLESGKYTELSYDFLMQKLSELPSKNTGQPD